MRELNEFESAQVDGGNAAVGVVVIGPIVGSQPGTRPPTSQQAQN